MEDEKEEGDIERCPITIDMFDENE